MKSRIAPLNGFACMCASSHGDARQEQQTQRRNPGVLDGPPEARDDVSVCFGAAVRGAARGPLSVDVSNRC